MKWRKYRQKDKSHRKAIILAYDNDQGYKRVVQEHNVNPDTAYRIAKKRSFTPKRRGGRCAYKITEPRREAVIKIVENNATFTLAQMEATLDQRQDLEKISMSSIDRILDNALITLKRLHLHTEVRKFTIKFTTLTIAISISEQKLTG